MSDKSSYFEARNVGITSRNIEWRFESTRANECSCRLAGVRRDRDRDGGCYMQRWRNWTMSLRSTGSSAQLDNVLAFHRVVFKF